MIPVTDNLLQVDFELGEIPSKTFKMHAEAQKITRYVDELEAMKQAIYLILNIERYRYLIYSWNYGVELADLFGQPTSFVQPEIKRRITEALMQDSRIQSVDAFSFEVNKGKVHARFTVHTIFGDVPAEKAVEI